MSFRRRTVLLAAGAVAAAVVIASVVVYFVTRGQLLDQIDRTLRQEPGSVEFVADPNAEAIAALGRGGKLAPDERLAVQASGKRSALSSGSASAPSSGSAASGGGSAASASGGSVAPAGGVNVGSFGGGAAIFTHAERITGPAPTAKTAKGPKTETVTIERRTVTLPRGTLAGQIPPTHLPAVQLKLPNRSLGAATGYVQLDSSNGHLLHSESRLLLPVTAATRAVAAGRRKPFFSDVKVAGTPVRMFTEAAAKGAAWQVALPLSDVDDTLSHLRLLLALVCLGGIALAAAFGLLVSRAALVPVRRLTGAAERVARTQDLGHRIGTGKDDDLGRLAGSFNTMLAALERSRLAQRQLVSDASHELRTPLTSVQANLDALALGERLSPSERARIVASVQAQLSELTVLVGDLVDLSKTEVEQLEVEDVRLDLAATAALQRARLHAPSCRFTLDAEPCLVRCAPGRLDRAIANLLDNACQWTDSPQAGPIEVRVRDGSLQVRDHGPGIAEEDLPRVFDRFYRSPVARARPGSGLGLAIVRHLAESHGGAVHAANAPGDGALLTLELPAVPMTEAELEACAPDEALHQAPRLL